MTKSHEHAHQHAHAANLTRLRIALVITGIIFIAEVVGAIYTHSLALLVDAGHMLTDSLGLVMACLAATLILRPASDKHTWGFARAEVLSATVQASVLLVVGLYAVVEGIRRFFDPPQIASAGLAIIGLIGLVANIASLIVLMGGRSGNLNMKAAFLEVANDALGSVAVLLAALVIHFTGWRQADAVAGLCVALLIVPRAISILKQAIAILLEATPADLDLSEVRKHLLNLDHVMDIHDLHSSIISTGTPILSCHAVLPEECFKDGHSQEILLAMQECLQHHHGLEITHSTLQLETFDNAKKHARLHA